MKYFGATVKVLRVGRSKISLRKMLITAVYKRSANKTVRTPLTFIRPLCLTPAAFSKRLIYGSDLRRE